MSIAIAEFWKLAVEGRLLTPADCQRLEAAFTHVKGAANQANAGTLGEWLVASGALSRYQVQTLLARRPGPFLFGDYCVYDRIRSKEGRLAGLYRAMHVATRHPVLLCFLSPEIARSPDAFQAAAGQIAWACWVAHPFVCECHQLLDLGQFKVVVIENLVGQSAGARLAGGVRVMPHDACRLAYQAALGLARIHQLGLVHGEIRPENFWVAPDGNVKLLQVPLAPEPLRGPKALDWSTPTAKLLTAADYAAPELAHAGRPPDPLTDIYALGATLYHFLSGAPPFPGNDLDVKKVLHAIEPVASLGKFGIPKQLNQVIAFMLAKDPAQRYQQAAQVAEALAHFVDPARIGAAPALAPTLPAYDQWLTGQPRVPGMAPGSIPTTLQMLTYTAAQYAAGQQAAAAQ
ncbi:MAG TPA: protein kinase, partial [Pirellulales bacterium]